MQLIVRFLLLNGIINDWEGILFTCEQNYSTDFGARIAMLEVSMLSTNLAIK